MESPPIKATTPTTSEPTRFELSIRLRHPTLSLAAATEAFGREPDVRRQAGSPRTTPKGAPLAGHWGESQFLWRASQQGDLVALIAWANGFLWPHRAFLQRLRAEGGSLEYFIGCFVADDTGHSLPPELLSACGELGASLSFDIYAPPREAPVARIAEVMAAQA